MSTAREVLNADLDPAPQGYRLPCPGWCVYQGETEETCFGEGRYVIASLYPRVDLKDGDWGDQYFSVYAQEGRLHREAVHIHLGLNDLPGWSLTPEESRLLAKVLIETADSVEAGEQR